MYYFFPFFNSLLFLVHIVYLNRVSIIVLKSVSADHITDVYVCISSYTGGVHLYRLILNYVAGFCWIVADFLIFSSCNKFFMDKVFAWVSGMCEPEVRGHVFKMRPGFYLNLQMSANHFSSADQFEKLDFSA